MRKSLASRLDTTRPRLSVTVTGTMTSFTCTLIDGACGCACGFCPSCAMARVVRSATLTARLSIRLPFYYGGCGMFRPRRRSTKLKAYGDLQQVTLTITHPTPRGLDVDGYFTPAEWSRSAQDDISLDEVRRALSTIPGSLSDALISLRQER